MRKAFEQLTAKDRDENFANHLQLKNVFDVLEKGGEILATPALKAKYDAKGDADVIGGFKFVDWVSCYEFFNPAVTPASIKKF